MFMDFESYHLRLGFLYGINDNWAVKVDVPYIYYGGGFLDSAVENWHDIFNLPEGNRPDVPKNQFNIIYAQNRSGTPANDININSSGGGLGDIQLAVARKLIKNSSSALSAWSSIDLPSGDADQLRGNDAVDVAVWLAGSHRLNQRWSTDANLGVLHPGENKLETLVVEDTFVSTGAVETEDGVGRVKIEFEPVDGRELFEVVLHDNGFLATGPGPFGKGRVGEIAGRYEAELSEAVRSFLEVG